MPGKTFNFYVTYHTAKHDDTLLYPSFNLACMFYRPQMKFGEDNVFIDMFLSTWG